MAKPERIPGIYNYCDRWCERCRFTDRCDLYQVGKRMEGAADPGAAFEAYWDEIHAEEDQGGGEWREDWAAELDDIDPEEAQAAMDEDEAREFLAEIDELSRSSMGYMKRAHKWLEKHAQDEAAAAVMAALDASADRARALEAVEIISWYHFQIAVKIRRALQGDDETEEYLASEGFDRDSDVSAKIALIGLDRSIAAWGYLRQHIPAQRDSILSMLTHLNHLRRGVERRFPNARALQRLGFDRPA